MKAKTKKQLREALDRGAKTAKKMGQAVVDEAQHAVRRYKRKRAIRKAGAVLLEIGKPAVAAAAAAAATVAAERLTRRGARHGEPELKPDAHKPGEPTPA